jgi:hypothetical protein
VLAVQPHPPMRSATRFRLPPGQKLHRGDSPMTTKHKHEGEQSVRVDLEKRNVYLGSQTYRWDDLNDGWRDKRYWSRISKTLCKKDEQKISYVPEEKRNHERHEWGDVLRPLDDNKRKDRHLIRELKRAVERAERKVEKQEKGKVAKLEDVLAMEEAAEKMRHLAEPESDSAADDEPKLLAATGSVKRTKRGVRISSNDHKFYFNVAVFKSTKYPGCASLQLVVAGKWYNYTLDADNMKALREEVARGGI